MGMKLCWSWWRNVNYQLQRSPLLLSFETGTMTLDNFINKYWDQAMPCLCYSILHKTVIFFQTLSLPRETPFYKEISIPFWGWKMTQTLGEPVNSTTWSHVGLWVWREAIGVFHLKSLGFCIQKQVFIPRIQFIKKRKVLLRIEVD